MQISKRIKLTTAFFITFFLISLYGHSQFPERNSYNFERISIQEGLSHVTVNTVYQDKKGFMWFGTVRGLNRYDGYNFRVYRNATKDSSTLISDYIHCIIEDENDDMWVGDAGGLNLYNREQDNFIRIFMPEFVGVQSLKSIGDNKIWVGCKNGLFLFDSKKREIIKSVSGKYINRFMISKDGKYWIGTENNGLFVANKKGITEQVFRAGDHGLNSNNIEVIHQDSKGVIRIGTEGGGLYEYNPKTKKLDNIDQPSKVIWDIIEVNNKLWLGTPDHGVVILDPNTKKYEMIRNKTNDPKSISEDHILTFFKDKSENIWLGGFRKGLNYWNSQTNAFNLISNNRGGFEILNKNNVISFNEDENHIYFGTDGGGLNVLDKKTKKIKVYQNEQWNPKSIGSNAVLSITKGKGGGFWIGTWGGGLNYFNPTTGDFKRFQNDPNNSRSLPSNNIWKGYEDSKGNFWIIVHDQGIFMFDPKTGEISKSILPLGPKESINSSFNFYESSEQIMYYVCYFGLYIYDLNTKKIIIALPDDTNPEMLQGAVTTSVYESKDGSMWIGTSNGLSKYDSKKNTFKTYGIEDGLVSEEVASIVEDNEGYLWLSAKNNIARFDPKTEKFVNYLGSDLSQEGEFNKGAGISLQNGEILFGNSSGVTLFDPNDASQNKVKPPVVFTDFMLFNETVSVGEEASPLLDVIEETEEITLNHEQSVFTIDFAALNYYHADKNQYKYKLEGFDDDWRDGSRRTATYTNLDPGTYNFHVIASNNHDIWNKKGDTITVNILPPWWKTLWFRISFVVILISLFFAFYKYRTIKLKREQRKLELIVQERTEEVVAQNEELSEQQKAITEQNHALQEQKQEITVQNEELTQQQEEILAQRNYIEEKNNQLQGQNETLKSQHIHITNSVRYAQTIQSAVLPNENYLSKMFKEHFLIYKPKDIVAGDFYWVGQNHNSTYVAVVDCTGHGVPGAFMSMIGNASFNYIINELKVQDPKEILERIHKRVREALKQDTSNNTDGMDICLCKITPSEDDETNEVVFAGAKRPLYYFTKDGQLHQVNGSKKAIGGMQRKNREFENNTLILSRDTVIYLTTDGYVDQNNHQRKKIGKIMFENVLKGIGRLPLNNQKEQLERLLSLHQEDEEQRDDITIMAIKA